MNKRIASIDTLRGISIFMMILCSTILWNAGLPAWMFHCQCPPPTYAFDPTVKGISWVDLVFPIFLFSMGASMPFSLGGKIRKGVPMGSIVLGIVKRWLTLAAFGLVLGNAGLIFQYDTPLKPLVRFAIWVGMFLALWRIPDGKKIKGWVVNLAGALIVCAMLVLEQKLFGVKLSFNSNNIIIMILSALALVGGLVWLLTREKIGWRLVILVAAAVLKEIDWQFHCLGFLEVPKAICWLFNWRYAQYIVVLILGTVVGDILMKASRSEEALVAEPKSWKSIVSAVLCFMMVPASLWGFYTRNIWPLFGIAAVAYAAVLVLGRNDNTPWKTIYRLGFGCLLLGIVFDPIDGGITKDHCNLSYMLSTGGLACLLTSFLLWCEAHAKLRGGVLSRNLSMTGQNPMIAYTVSGFVTLPILHYINFSWFQNHCAAPFLLANYGVSLGPVLSFVLAIVPGLVVTGLMMAITCLCTKAKIFWRS